MKKEQSCFSLMSSQGCLAPFHLVELSFSVLLTPFASQDSPRGSGYHRYPLPLGESGMTHGKARVPYVFRHQLRNGLPVINRDWIRSWVFSVPHRLRKASRSRSSTCCSVTG